MTENCRQGNLDTRNCERVAGPVKSNLMKYGTVLPTSECPRHADFASALRHVQG